MDWKKLICKHQWKINRWHWFHGVSMMEPRRAEVELICKKCGKTRYIYPERNGYEEGMLIKKHSDKYEL